MVRLLLRRFMSPAVIFLMITVVVSVIVFYFALKSGVPKFSFPQLNTLTIANANSIAVIYQVEKDVPIINISYSPDGNYLAVNRLDDIIHVWSTSDFQLIYTFTAASFCWDCIAFSPDNRLMATVREGRPYDVMVWNLETGKSFWESTGLLVNSEDILSSLAFSPDGKLMVGAIGNRVLFWKVDTTGCQLVRELIGHSKQVKSVAFSPDGKRLLTTSADYTAIVWDVNTGNLLTTLKGHTDVVAKGVYSPDGKWIVTAGYDRTIRLWDPLNGELKKVLSNHASPVITLAFSPNGQLFASGGSYEQIILWNAMTMEPILKISEYTLEVSPLAFSPDSKILVTTNADGTLKVWGVEK